MKLIKKDSNFKIYDVDSESELRALCKDKYSTILGFDSESKKKYNYIEIQYQNTEKIYGLIHSGHVEPIVIKIDEKDLAVISFDKSVYWICLEKNNIKQVSFNSLVYDAFLLTNDNNILFICELDVRCMSLDCSQIWRYDCDIINSFTLHENYLEISTDDGDSKISLKDGGLI